MAIPERRASRRVELTRPCKIYAARAGRYVAGSTRNLSSGGALLELDRRAPLEPGERVAVGISPSRHPGLLRADEMHQATVVRSESTSAGRTPVAIRFATPIGELREEPVLARAA